MPERIADGGETLAILVYADAFGDGTEFVTPDDYPLQVGLLSYDDGESAVPHRHAPREVGTVGHQEFVHVETGVIDVEIYDTDDDLHATRTLESGDSALFVAGGRGWTTRGDAEVIEIKLGPYRGEGDKIPL